MADLRFQVESPGLESECLVFRVSASFLWCIYIAPLMMKNFEEMMLLVCLHDRHKSHELHATVYLT